MKINNLLIKVLLFVNIVLLFYSCQSHRNYESKKNQNSFYSFSSFKDSNSKDTMIRVYRSALCGCCKDWVDYLKYLNYQVEDNVYDSNEDVVKQKEKYKIPEELYSCHTAIVEGYVIEGHVPAQDIRSIIDQKSKAIGLSVPGMVHGSPGMQGPNYKNDPFSVIAFTSDEQRVFNKYKNY